MSERSDFYNDFFGNPDISEREKYKYYTLNNSNVLVEKEKIRKIVTKKGLSSVMNDTKWLKLQNAIKQLPFPPPYIEKLIIEDKTYEEVKISKTPHWLGNWEPFYNEGMYLFFTIEYIKVRPCYAEHRGNLVAPKIFDETEEFKNLLKELHIPYEEDEGIFTIFGYR
ncbi:hypothetical protein EZ456_02335 [Pedobacter psychrodurus]|uniref:Uncharacterized protein n=1 Tax=Pedobacter psychrodurus TaxID=2530456 RepID=A0A4V2MRC2_9SPHI|nr:DUF6678 family protein [Pedobacter psychrodurus]TCD29018.1 hypothetical protein EZ456_02335 [Pedobacter psychrodurus]